MVYLVTSGVDGDIVCLVPEGGPERLGVADAAGTPSRVYLCIHDVFGSATAGLVVWLSVGLFADVVGDRGGEAGDHRHIRLVPLYFVVVLQYFFGGGDPHHRAVPVGGGDELRDDRADWDAGV